MESPWPDAIRVEHSVLHVHIVSDTIYIARFHNGGAVVIDSDSAAAYELEIGLTISRCPFMLCISVYIPYTHGHDCTDRLIHYLDGVQVCQHILLDDKTVVLFSGDGKWIVFRPLVDLVTI